MYTMRERLYNLWMITAYLFWTAFVLLAIWNLLTTGTGNDSSYYDPGY